MKTFVRSSFIFLILLVLLITALSIFWDVKQDAFCNCGYGYMIDIAFADVGLLVFISTAVGLAVAYSFYSLSKRSFLLVFLTLGVWFLSGRTVGIKTFHEPSIMTGWFYTETKRFDICDQKDNDCEVLIYYHTELIKKPFWRVQIKNRVCNETFFVGPFIWEKTLSQINKYIQQKDIRDEKSK